jgi:hypothetical protein
MLKKCQFDSVRGSVAKFKRFQNLAARCVESLLPYTDTYAIAGKERLQASSYDNPRVMRRLWIIICAIINGQILLVPFLNECLQSRQTSISRLAKYYYSW